MVLILTEFNKKINYFQVCMQLEDMCYTVEMRKIKNILKESNTVEVPKYGKRAMLSDEAAQAERLQSQKNDWL